MASYGINFQPGTEGPTGQGGRATGPGAAPIQTALQLLNLRLPSVVGARSLAPQQLLQAPGGMSGGLDIVELLRRLAQQSGARLPQMPNQMPPSQAPRLPDVRQYGDMLPIGGQGASAPDGGQQKFPQTMGASAPPYPRVIVDNPEPSGLDLSASVNQPQQPMGVGAGFLNDLLTRAGVFQK